MPSTLTPSALRRLEEQQDRNAQILERLSCLQRGLEHCPPEAFSLSAWFWDLQTALADLHFQGLLRRDGDHQCLQAWMARISPHLAHA